MDLENSGERKKNKKEIRKEAKKRKLQSLIDLTEGNEADQSVRKLNMFHFLLLRDYHEKCRFSKKNIGFFPSMR